ncbi:MAG: FixH family protein, partial [Pseudolabrys sp.]
MAPTDKPREVTGRTVLFWLVGFFGLVFVVNGFMADAAISTFAGVDTPSSYKAGQMFEGEIHRAER